MAGKIGAEIEHQIALGIKRKRSEPLRANGFFTLDTGKLGLCAGGIIAFRSKAGQAEDGGAVGRMTDAGKGERPVEIRLQAFELKRRAAHRLEETRGGDHGAHGVRRGRADADLEHLENRQKHQKLSLARVGGFGTSGTARIRDSKGGKRRLARLCGRVSGANAPKITQNCANPGKCVPKRSRNPTGDFL